jgi:putative lipoic acid-binding regulatory protein
MSEPGKVFLQGRIRHRKIMSRNIPISPIYPCVFPVKIIGECCSEFESNVFSVMKRYVKDLYTEQIGRRKSKGGKYLSLTINIMARDREYIEKIYAELIAQEKVIFVI